MGARILAIVDHEPEWLHRLQQAGRAEAVTWAELRPPRPHADVVVLDPATPTDLERARRLVPGAAVVALTGDVAEALLAGADFALPAGVAPEAVEVTVERALEHRRLRRAATRAEVGRGAIELGDFPGIVGAHPSMQQLLQRVIQVAKTRATVLICGETGTGKELIAGAIHLNSARRNGPFVKLNCAALAESVLESELFGHERGAFTGATTRRIGRFEQAHGGTLFLDEISELSMGVQVKLLRFLQEREVERVGGNETLKLDVRVVAATNRDLAALVREGSFREDLYYRLNVVRLDVPPLRARPSDILLLAQHFAAEVAKEHDLPHRPLTDAAKSALLAHPWPGNVRALRNAIERALVLCDKDVIDAVDLPIEASAERNPLPVMVPGVTLDELERWAILTTLKATGSVQQAAAVLGVSRRTIQYRLQSWGLTAKELLRPKA